MAKNPKAPDGPFHPGPGTGHEVGVMFAFIIVFILLTLVYLLFWRISNKKEETLERQRRQALREKLGTTGAEEKSSGEIYKD